MGAGLELARVFFSTGWFVYRRIYVYGIANIVLPFLFLFLWLFLAVITAQLLPVTKLALTLWFFGVALTYIAVVLGIIPAYANAIYYRHLMAQFAHAVASPGVVVAKKTPRPPSAWTVLGAVIAVIVGALATVVPWGVIMSPQMYEDYTVRSKVSEGVSAAGSLRAPIAEFYKQYRRLPEPREAGRFRYDSSSRYTASVVYDAERKAIIATMGEWVPIKGKRFAMYVREQDGTLEWTCRTIDLEAKWLPGACR